MAHHPEHGHYPVELAFDGLINTFWHSYAPDQGNILLTQHHDYIFFSGGISGGILKVVFNQPKSIEAIRLYRRVNCCSDRYNKLSVTVRVSSKAVCKKSYTLVAKSLQGHRLHMEKVHNVKRGRPFQSS